MTGSLSIRDLSKSFGGVRAVDGVDLEIVPGQVHSLIGPNGAGKTTVFNCIAGVFRPDGGQVMLDGQDVTGWPPHRLVSAGMARTFQITKIFGELTVMENIALAARSRAGRNLSFWRSADGLLDTRMQVIEILTALEIADRSDVVADHLAHGEKRVVELAIALALKPRMILLDEPTAGMSSGETERIAKLIRSLTTHATVLLVEHDMDIVLGISDQVTVMAQGRIISSGTPAVVRQDARVQEAYLGRAKGRS